MGRANINVVRTTSIKRMMSLYGAAIFKVHLLAVIDAATVCARDCVVTLPMRYG